jgi:hypothetical protein
VLLIDSSVWIDFLRGSPTPAREGLRSLLQTRCADVATTEPIILELLAPNGHALAQLEALTNGLPLLTVDARLDYRSAAALYRTARRTGRTVRRLINCLIAAVALRTEATVVRKDADYDALADVVPLDVVSFRIRK